MPGSTADDQDPAAARPHGSDHHSRYTKTASHIHETARRADADPEPGNAARSKPTKDRPTSGNQQRTQAGSLRTALIRRCGASFRSTTREGSELFSGLA